MEQHSLFNMPEPEPTPQPDSDIPRATDVGGVTIGLRGIPNPEVKVINGITHEIYAGGTTVDMTLNEHSRGSIHFKMEPHAHWYYEAYRAGDFIRDHTESFEKAHKEILKLWNKEIP